MHKLLTKRISQHLFLTVLFRGTEAIDVYLIKGDLILTCRQVAGQPNNSHLVCIYREFSSLSVPRARYLNCTTMGLKA